MYSIKNKVSMMEEALIGQSQNNPLLLTFKQLLSIAGTFIIAVRLRYNISHNIYYVIVLCCKLNSEHQVSVVCPSVPALYI